MHSSTDSQSSCGYRTVVLSVNGCMTQDEFKRVYRVSTDKDHCRFLAMVDELAYSSR